jgi:hypothetical protein
MAHVTNKQEAFVSRELGASYLRRVTGDFRLGLRNFALDLDRARRELRVAHDLRDLDLRLLRDIGVERDAC